MLVFVLFLLSGALRNTSQGKEASKTDFSEVVKKWLRYAPDRDGGSGRQ